MVESAKDMASRGVDKAKETASKVGDKGHGRRSFTLLILCVVIQIVCSNGVFF